VVFGQGGAVGQHWVGTWFASSTARVDQPPPQNPPAGQNAQNAPATQNAQALVVPPAVLAVAPGQPLPVGGQSPLHFNNQTLRQIAHISLGGSRLRVVFSNTFGTAPLTIGTAQVALRDKDAAI